MKKAVLTLFLSAGLVSTSSWSASQYQYTYHANGKIETINGPRSDVNDTTTFTYDGMGNLYSKTDALGNTDTFPVYSTMGYLKEYIDPNGIKTVFTHDARGRITSTRRVHPSGLSALDALRTYQLDNIGQPVQIHFESGETMVFVYDDARRLEKHIDALGNSIEYEYDNASNITEERIKDASGNITYVKNYIYDKYGNLESIRNHERTIARYTHDDNGNVVSVSDANSNTTNIIVNAHGEKKEEVNPLFDSTLYDYDGLGRIASVTDARGNTTTFEYDYLGNVIRTVSPDSGETSYSYDDAGNRLSASTLNGLSHSYRYDALNRLTQVDHGNNGTIDITFAYDSAVNGKGLLASATDITGSESFSYNFLGLPDQVTTTINSSDYILGYVYDNSGKVTEITYPSGRRVIYVLDSVGNIAEVKTIFDGETTTLASNISYLPFGPVSAKNLGNNIQISKQYDQSYRLISNVHAAVTQAIITYDENGNVSSIQDSQNSTKNQQFSYDELNRLTSASGSYGSQSYTYDASGNRTSLIPDDYSYEPTSNRLLSTSDWVYTYNAEGSVTSKIKNDSSGNGFTFEYGDNGRLISVTKIETVTNGPAGNSTTTQANEIIATYGYNYKGQRVFKQTPAGEIHFIYDSRGRLIAESDVSGSTLREYVYINQQLAAIIEYSADSSSSTPAEFIFDNDGPDTDKTGKWSVKINRKNKHHGTDFLVAGSKGTKSFRWNLSGVDGTYEVFAYWLKSRKSTTQAPYEIAHEGGVSEVTRDQTVNGRNWISLGTYNFEPSDINYVEVSNANGRVVADAIRLVEIPSQPAKDNELYYVHNNHLGAPVALTDDSGSVVWSADYEPFGRVNVSIESIVNNVRFPGQYYDQESQLHYNYYRDYDPSTGRYIQSDPIGLLGGLNTYSYVGSNPLLFIDPLGLFEITNPATWPQFPQYVVDASMGVQGFYRGYGRALDYSARRAGLYGECEKKKAELEGLLFGEIIHAMVHKESFRDLVVEGVWRFSSNNLAYSIGRAGAGFNISFTLPTQGLNKFAPGLSFSAHLGAEFPIGLGSTIGDIRHYIEATTSHLVDCSCEGED